MSTFSRGVMAIGAVLALSGAASAQDKKKDPKADASIAAEFSPVYAVVDRAMSGQGGVSTEYGAATYLATTSEAEGAKTEPAPADAALPFEFRHDVLKGQDNKIYIPFSVLVDKSKLANPRLALVTRLAPKGATGPEAPLAPAAAAASKDKKSKDKKGDAPAPPRYLWDDALEVDLPAVGQSVNNYRGVGALSVEPGTYDLYIAFRERSTSGAEAAPAPVRVTLLKKEFTVPDLTKEFTTSSVILTDKVEVLNEPLSPERQRENPYTLGVLKLLPSVDNTFAKAGELNMFFWIYGAALDAGKKPNVEVEYNFHQKTADGEKFFNKTDPQVMNAETLPATFDLAAGHQLTGSLAVPLASFPDGQYRLELKITDKIAGKTITRESTFTVAAQ